MATTTNKGYELMATGTHTDTWGSVLNTSVFTIIDNNLGSVTTKSLSSSNVTLSATESQSAILRLTGTLSANVQITTSCVGFFFVENLTTGSYTVTITNGVAGVVAPQSQRMVVIADSTNGVRLAAQTSFPSGTKMPFYQAVAPTGWTKDTTATINSAGIKLTTGSDGGTTGGTAAWSDVLKSWELTQANLPSCTFPNTIEISGSQSGGLARNVAKTTGNTGSNTGSLQVVRYLTWSDTTLSISGSVTSGGSGTPIDLALKHVIMIIATKD